MSLPLQIEALIFAAEHGISEEELLHLLSDCKLTSSELKGHLAEIQHKYANPDSVLALHFINNSYQFLTKAHYHEVVNKMQSHRSKKRLSQAALETLAIIAYRQPITKLEIEHIRGVNCDYSVQRLLEKELIKIVGKSESVGRPLLYGTSEMLMDYFGINDSSELPKLKEIAPTENEIGTVSSQ